MEYAKAMKVAAAPQFQQESFSEYHLYSLGRRTSVEDKETKQISLLQGSGVPVEKLFVVNGQNFYYHNAQAPGAPLKDPVQVFTNLRMKRRQGWAFRCQRATCASIRRIPRAVCSLSAKITLTTRPNLNSSR